MRCLHCGKRLSLLRKFSDGEFCSPAHRDFFHQQQSDMALARLIESQNNIERPRAPKPVPVPKQAPEAGAPEEPIIPYAGILPDWFRPVLRRIIYSPELYVAAPDHENYLPADNLKVNERGFDQSGALNLPAPVTLPDGQSKVMPPRPLFRMSVEMPVGGDECRSGLVAQSEAPLELSLAALPGCTSLHSKSTPLTNLQNPAAPEAGHVLAAPEFALAGTEQLTAHGALAGAAVPTEAQPLPAVGALAMPASGLRALAADCEPAVEEHEEALESLLSLIRAVGVQLSLPAPIPVPFQVAQGVAEFEVPDERAMPALATAAVVPEMRGESQMAGLSTGEAVASVWERKRAPRTKALEPAFDAALPVHAHKQKQPSLARSGRQARVRVRALAAAAGVSTGVPYGPLPPAEGVPATPIGAAQAARLELRSHDALSAVSMAAAQPGPLAGMPVPPCAALAAADGAPDYPRTRLSVEQVQEPVDIEAPAPLQSQLPYRPGRAVDRAPALPRVPSEGLDGLWSEATALKPMEPVSRLTIDQADGSGPRQQSATGSGNSKLRRYFKFGAKRLPGRRFWVSAPADLKWVAVGLPLILVLVVYSFKGGSSKVEASQQASTPQHRSLLSAQFASLQKVLLERAAVKLFDDFRGGLGSWQGGEGWAKTWRYGEASFLEPGQLALYTPTLRMHDYSMQFLGQIEHRSLNWVFRAADEKNYYAMRIVITKEGPLPAASVVRYAVVDGKEQALKVLPLPLPVRSDTLYLVRMDVRGDDFTTYIQNQVIDTFSDTRFQQGGIGFFSPKGDRSYLRWVEITHQYDYVGRLCALVAPYDPQAEARSAE